MLILVGSLALSHYIKLDRDVSKSDIDLVGTYDEIRAFAKNNNASSFIPINDGKYVKFIIDGVIYEAEVAYPESSAEQLIDVIDFHDDFAFNGKINTIACKNSVIVPSLNFLYTLKMSHRFLRNSPHFQKTMDDILLMRKYGAKIPEQLQQFYENRQMFTYDYGHPKLSVTKTDFFKDDGIQYVYDHDSIHEIVKNLDRPAYTYFKPVDNQVMVSKGLWNELSADIRLFSVYEEACVLAIERSLVPHPNALTPYKAFEKALSKVCTSISSGWWRDYAWEQYYVVLSMYSEDYWIKFQKAVENNEVKLFNGSKY
jgi:hypothetical protein